jgi:hypothetical protein
MKKVISITFYLFTLTVIAQKNNLNELYSKLNSRLNIINDKKLDTINLKFDSLNLTLNKIYENGNYKIYHYQKLNGEFKDSSSFFDRKAYFFVFCKKIKKGIMFRANNCCYYTKYKNSYSYSFRSDCASRYLTDDIFYLYNFEINTHSKLIIKSYEKMDNVIEPLTNIRLCREKDTISILNLYENYADIIIEELIILIEKNSK